MKPLATFKHISSKNVNYGDAEKYLTFAHDEFTMKPTLDADGRLVPREDYRISTLNCGEDDFAVACMRSNLRYGKNQKREDVKSHHYIISFDPRDGPDNGLTVDKAQELGERFCREQFPGHQAIICTHPDGHNQSGNIHVHIVINSLRIENVPLLPYMDRPADTKAGCKHRCTDAAMEYFKSEVMELCHEAGLYQIDLLNGSANRVTEREYWARKKGQAALDQENAALATEGKPTKPPRFETDKEKLRQIIRKTLNESFTVEDFAQKLLQYGVTVKESRGRFSYLTPDRTKPITARKLGDSFDKAAVLAALEQNALRSEHTLTSNDGTRRITELTEEIEELKTEKNFLLRSLNCADDADISDVKKEIATLEIALKKLDEQEVKYATELEDAMKQYAELNAQVADMDAVELKDARLIIRPDRERSATDRIKAAYGEKYDPVMMHDSKRDVANLLNEETGARSVRNLLRQTQKMQQMQQRREPKRHERER